jgi:hypothetical protein
MRSISGLIKFAVFLAVVAGIGVGVGWLATRPKSSPSTANPAAAPLPAQDTFKPVTAPKPGSAAAGAHGGGVGAVAGGPVSADAAAAAELKAHWEDKIGDILTSDADVTNKCHDLLEMFPHLPEPGQVEAAHHLSNLVDSDNYAPLGKILTDPSYTTAVYDVLMLDVVNRPGSVKLPTLLEIARNPSHPEAADARSKLALYLDEDYGTDWDKWDDKIKDWLTNNPD